MQSHGDIYGLDISSDHLDLAATNLPGIPLTRGDAHDLPYPAAVFDIALCHFLILWVSDPGMVVREMGRVTKPGGVVLVLAEPDYGGRIDYPPELGVLGDWQRTSLLRQGADPLIGRSLRAVLKQAGLIDIEAGLLGGQWSGTPPPEDWEMEWKVIEEDIKIVTDISAASEINKLQELDKLAWEKGERVLFVPTFYACGRVPAASPNG
jgi:SAM-dependent methyltransferase